MKIVNEIQRRNIIKKIIVLLLICLISCTFAACEEPPKLEGDLKLKPIESTVNMFYDTATKQVYCLEDNKITPCRGWISGSYLYWDGCNIVNVKEDM